jgi:hypothetical protein
VAAEEVVGLRDDGERFGSWERIIPGCQAALRSVLVKLPLHDQFGLAALSQGIGCQQGRWNSNADELAHAAIGAANGQSNPGAEREAREADWRTGISVRDLVERRPDIFALAITFVIDSCAAAYTTEVETQRRNPQIAKRLRYVKDDFVVHRATVRRVWVTDDRHHCWLRRLVIGQTQQSLQRAM